MAITYWNHFHNRFHFDDIHAIVNNAYIRDLRNIPRFFTDGSTLTVQPANQAYRPLLTTSLAIDYRLAGGLNPFYFQLSTFLWYLLQLALMFVLFYTIIDRAWPDVRSRYAVLLAVAWYALNPVMAETVNYVVQRADLLSTVGVIAALVVWIVWPGGRKYGLYLVPYVLAVLAKQPALIFPALLFAYEFLIEEDARRPGLWPALKRSLPAFAVTLLLALFEQAMIPKTFAPGGYSGFAYRITQPLAAFHYFVSFFFPFWLTADTDRTPIDTFDSGDVWIGFFFVAAVSARDHPLCAS